MPAISWTLADPLILRLRMSDILAEHLSGLAATCFDLSKNARCPCPATFLICGALLAEAFQGTEGEELSSLQLKAIASLSRAVALSIEHGCQNGDETPWKGFEVHWAELRQGFPSN